MDVAFALDTNAIVYEFADQLADPLPAGPYAVSVMSEMELLAYPSLSEHEEQRIRTFLSRVVVVDLTPDVRETAVRLCRAHRLKLPDAIIAATALVLDVELLTNDARLLRVPELRTREVRLRDG